MTCPTPKNSEPRNGTLAVDGSWSRRDALHVVLWGNDKVLIEQLIDQAAACVIQRGGSAAKQTVGNILQKSRHGIDWARAVYLLLLNVDPTAKMLASKGIPELGLVPLLEPRAVGFFCALANEVVPTGQRNEFSTAQQLIANARNAYLVA